jgi:precorrin-2 dehydrogenase / sirohydrochlorin ferrochelatase
MSHAFPVFLDVAEKPCLVIGGGPMAAAKAGALLEAGARVTVIAPALCGEYEACAGIRWIARDYEPGDLRGIFLAIAARDDRSLNATIFAEAEQAQVLLNCLDDPEHCRFIFPAQHRQGRLTVAISTDGACPALAVRLRERIAADTGPEYAEFLERTAALRDRIATRWPDFETRKALWYRIVDSPVLQLLKEGRGEEADATVEAILKSLS